jgi:hypothetical protein
MDFEQEMFEKKMGGNHPRRRRRKPEMTVQKQIVECLVSQLGAVVAVTDAGALARLGLNMSCGIPTGWPDIVACLPSLGQFLGVECKAAKGRQSPAQKRMQERIEHAGGLYILAHSLEEFKQEWDKHLPIND